MLFLSEKSLLRVYYIFPLFLLVSGCTKTNVLTDPPVGPIQPSTNNNKPNGILYVNNVGQFVKMDTKDSTVLWTSRVLNLFGSSLNPISLDSGTFYHGNASGVTAYSSQTGIPRWSTFFMIASNAQSFREVAIKDSLIFVTSPSSIADAAYLYCCKKATGKILWKIKIDLGDNISIPFNTAPMVNDDNVIVLTKDPNNHTHLTAFKIADATQQWTSESNDSLSFQLKFANGKIYSTSVQNVYCYKATDGSLLWHTDLQLTSFKYPFKFIAHDTLLLVNWTGKNYSFVTLNANNGNIIRKSNLAAETRLSDCNFSGNTLYISGHPTMDTVSISAYDLSTLSLKWEKRFPGYFYSAPSPLLTDKYCIVPIYDDGPVDTKNIYFIDLEGKLISTIPFPLGSTDGLIYIENGITYKLNSRYVN